MAARNRFSLAQIPLADTDLGYYLPAFNKLGDGAFTPLHGVHFFYPGCVYLLLSLFGDIRAIAVLQHSLGLAAGALFLVSWGRLSGLLPSGALNYSRYRWIGLAGTALFLFANNPILFEHQIRSDAICMFLEMLSLCCAINCIHHAVIRPDRRRAVVYAFVTAISCFGLVSAKPSFLVTAVLLIVVTGYLILRGKRSATLRIAFVGTIMFLSVALASLQSFFARGDVVTATFLQQTLFIMHAKIICAQMTADLESGTEQAHAEPSLRNVRDDLRVEIQRTHMNYPNKYPRLGFEPDYLATGPDALLERWRAQWGDERYREFLSYWYFHALTHRPVAFAGKIVRQLTAFYRFNCPAFSARKRLTFDFDRSLAALSKPQVLPALEGVAAAASFYARTNELRLHRASPLQEIAPVHLFLQICGRSYFAVLLLALAVVCWTFARRARVNSFVHGPLVVIFLYAITFGNVVAISVVHSMEVWRYSGVLFPVALLAHLWAISWLIALRCELRSSLVAKP